MNNQTNKSNQLALIIIIVMIISIFIVSLSSVLVVNHYYNKFKETCVEFNEWLGCVTKEDIAKRTPTQPQQ